MCSGRKRIIGLLILTMVSFCSCWKEPKKIKPCFEVSPANLTACQEVFFTDCSRNGGSSPSDYTWEFRDGTTGSGRSVSHIYTVGGTYDVRLTVANDEGNDHEFITKTITVIGGTGKCSFWHADAGPDIDVTIDGVTKTITQNYSIVTNCETPGCANFNLPLEKYFYIATQNDFPFQSWSGWIEIGCQSCYNQQLPP